MSRTHRPILAYHPGTRRAYVFPSQTHAAKWLMPNLKGRRSINSVRSNLFLVSHDKHNRYRRMLYGFVWVRGEDEARLINNLTRRLRVWALRDAAWASLTDEELGRGLEAARVSDPACGVTIAEGLPDRA